MMLKRMSFLQISGSNLDGFVFQADTFVGSAVLLACLRVHILS
jgi:hypothetical protein